ncbi:class I SAM-dependent methyltransferase family protein [Candidatus Woesearchaeota archaeon]|nr:class I SAM-dependent methyltransferase family protein [Candidatus Woesearchaeota archaeon]
MASLKEYLKNKLSENKLNLVPKSFDQIGSIALFNEFPKELKKEEKIIADALLRINKSIKTVAIKKEKFSGKFRLQKIRIIAGKKTKETTHKENNIQLKLDIEKVYFTPRLSTERLRISSLVKPNETVLVMFSGVSVFPIVIAKNSKPKEIYAVEINPIAHKYSLENINLNKISIIKAFKGDVKKILPKINKKFDRIIMPLPKDAETFLDLALKHLNKKGIIHFYDFSKEEEFPKSSINKIKEHCKKFKIINTVKCGQYAPRVYRVCIDFQPT